MNIFEFSDYRKFLQKRFHSMPKRGHGQARRLAASLKVSTTFVSQVFQERRDLSSEQACGVCDFLGLSEIETNYFLLLVQQHRAGTVRLRQHLQKELDRTKAIGQKISSRLDVKKILSDEDKSIFYSDWYFSAVRLMAGINGFQSPERIADHLGLPLKLTNEVILFLLQRGLLVNEGETLKVGPSRTHLEADSPFIKNHHQNWRLRALENIKGPKRMHYSAPMTIGVADVEKIQSRLLKCIEDVAKIIDPAPNEELMCLNIDWFPICK
jgi:uncharacterized protein (TIGR02147 family)